MAAGLAGLCVSLYVLGMYLVGMGPRAWLRIFTEADPTPLMYDGKEPYAQWAEKMEMARRTQAREERDEG